MIKSRWFSQIATALSGGRRPSGPAAAETRPGGRLAPFSQLDRVSHLAIFRVLPWILMSSSACLVTSSPSFDEPSQTKPFLDFESASPDPRRILTIEPGSQERHSFSALVRSEDLEEDVRVRLLVDYGKCGSNGSPFAGLLLASPVPASTFDDTGRKAVVDTTLESLSEGCHRLTMIATHEFEDPIGCPTDPEDFTQITWTVFVCKDNCATDPITCPVVEASCTDRTACAQ